MNVEHRIKLAAMLTVLFAAATGCSDRIAGPDSDPGHAADARADVQPLLAAQPNERACWGQATRVFAATGAMGEHASQHENPRLGLRNLARALYEAGIIGDDSMQALGAFVAGELGLSIDACA